MQQSISKPDLRKTALASRQSIPLERRTAMSKACCALLLRHIEKLAHTTLTIAGYAPVKGELDVMPALRALSETHITALPVVSKGDRELSFRRFTPETALAPGKYGIHIPTPDTETVIPDIVIVPLLAFDSALHRLGYGAGYYDATMLKLRALKPVTAIGVGFAQQEVKSIPAEMFDQPLDAVVTEGKVITIA